MQDTCHQGVQVGLRAGVQGPVPQQQLGGELLPQTKQTAARSLVPQGASPLTSKSEHDGSSPLGPRPPALLSKPTVCQGGQGLGAELAVLASQTQKSRLLFKISRGPGHCARCHPKHLNWCPAQLLAQEQHWIDVSDSRWGLAGRSMRDVTQPSSALGRVPPPGYNGATSTTVAPGGTGLKEKHVVPILPAHCRQPHPAEVGAWRGLHS